MAVINSINGTVVAHGVQVANTTASGFNSTTLSNGQLLIGSTGNAPVAATVSAGSGISVTNGAGSISIATVAPPFVYQNVTTNSTLAAANGYFVTSGALNLALPATSALGDTIVVSLNGGTSWKITQAAGQSIKMGSSVTTTGATGYLQSTAEGDTITLVASTANTQWKVISAVGNITVN